jgi:hypothetical protein
VVVLHLETNEDGDRVFIHADEAGIARLRETLQFLDRGQNQPEHDHLLPRGEAQSSTKNCRKFVVIWDLRRIR